MKPMALLAMFLVLSLPVRSQLFVDHFKDLERSDLMVLGTIHFKDAGLDSYKPKVDLDIMNSKRQMELEALLKRLGEFAPTKIALEVDKRRQTRLDSLYQEYLNGNFELKSNEIYQIGFRLAKRLGHKKVYAVDAPKRGFYDDMSQKEYNALKRPLLKDIPAGQKNRERMLHNRFMSLYDEEDHSKQEQTLLEILSYENDPERTILGHGHYLINTFKLGDGSDYLGADASIGWYVRNLRIFQNILQIQEPGQDRILLLIGSGHKPLLDFLAKSSIDFRYVDPLDILK